MGSQDAQKAATLRRLMLATRARAVALGRLLRALRTLNARRRAELKALNGPAPLKRPRFGLDWAWGSMPLRALLRSGATFACRYLSHDPSKNLSPAEARELSKAVAIVVVWETTADRAAQGEAAGREDAAAALAQAHAIGIPKGAGIYAAVDFDAAGSQVHDYFVGWSAGILAAGYRPGAYGGLHAITWLFDHKLIVLGWQTYAWSGGHWDFRAQLQQFSNGHSVGGVDCDYDRAVSSDFGQWRL